MAGIVAGKTAIVTGAGAASGAASPCCSRRKARVSWSATSAPACKAKAATPARRRKRSTPSKKPAARRLRSTLSITEPKNAEAIVKSALEAFGRVDILVNNAGILRDVIFHKMSWSDWSDVIAVHLNGSFNMSRAVAPLFREQNSGAFVHMTSTSGLVGNFGQANYMAAKLGIMGLSRGIALDMARFNVRSNCIAPFAFTRMIELIPRPVGTGQTPHRSVSAHDAGEDRAACSLSCAPMRQRHHRANLLGPQQRDLPVQPAAADQDHSSRRRLDAGTACGRAKTAFASSFTPLERSEDVFNWDPI